MVVLLLVVVGAVQYGARFEKDYEAARQEEEKAGFWSKGGEGVLKYVCLLLNGSCRRAA